MAIILPFRKELYVVLNIELDYDTLNDSKYRGIVSIGSFRLALTHSRQKSSQGFKLDKPYFTHRFELSKTNKAVYLLPVKPKQPKLTKSLLIITYSSFLKILDNMTYTEFVKNPELLKTVLHIIDNDQAAIDEGIKRLFRIPEHVAYEQQILAALGISVGQVVDLFKVVESNRNSPYFNWAVALVYQTYVGMCEFYAKKDGELFNNEPEEVGKVFEAAYVQAALNIDNIRTHEDKIWNAAFDVAFTATTNTGKVATEVIEAATEPEEVETDATEVVDNQPEEVPDYEKLAVEFRKVINGVIQALETAATQLKQAQERAETADN